MKASSVAPENIEVPVGVPQTFDEHIKLQFDLLSLALQADITRVGTLLFARDLTGRTYPESDAPTSGFHGVSHHGEDPRQIAQLSKINQYHVKMVAYLVERLAKVKEGKLGRKSADSSAEDSPYKEGGFKVYDVSDRSAPKSSRCSASHGCRSRSSCARKRSA